MVNVYKEALAAPIKITSKIVLVKFFEKVLTSLGILSRISCTNHT